MNRWIEGKGEVNPLRATGINWCQNWKISFFYWGDQRSTDLWAPRIWDDSRGASFWGYNFQKWPFSSVVFNGLNALKIFYKKYSIMIFISVSYSLSHCWKDAVKKIYFEDFGHFIDEIFRSPRGSDDTLDRVLQPRQAREPDFILSPPSVTQRLHTGWPLHRLFWCSFDSPRRGKTCSYYRISNLWTKVQSFLLCFEESAAKIWDQNLFFFQVFREILILPFIFPIRK